MEHKPEEYYSFVRLGKESFISLDTIVRSMPQGNCMPIEAFKRNLMATAFTATIPYRMAFSSIWRRNLEFNLLLERRDDRRNANKKAREKVEREMKSESGKKRCWKHILSLLSHELEMEEAQFSACELIRQCTVQVWSALEVFAADIFVSLLNAKPNLAITLMKDENAKRLFQLKSVPFDMFEQHNFSFSSSMGNLLAEHHRIDTVPSMKIVFGALLPNRPAILRTLSKKDLWLLFQRRHLIVHRRGIVDRSFLKATGESVPLGSEIRVFPAELETYIKLVLAAATAIAAGVAMHLKPAKAGFPE